MRAAPPVSVPCTGGLPWRTARALLPALAAGAAATWALGRAELPAWPAALLAGGVALWAWWRAAEPGADLKWDGQTWAADGVPGALDVMIDIGPWLLLRLRPTAPGAARWLALTAREAGPAWHGLRAAAYAQGPQGAAARLPADRAAG